MRVTPPYAHTMRSANISTLRPHRQGVFGIKRDINLDRQPLVGFPGPKPEVTCPHVARVLVHVPSKCHANPNMWHIKIFATRDLRTMGMVPGPNSLILVASSFQYFNLLDWHGADRIWGWFLHICACLTKQDQIPRCLLRDMHLLEVSEKLADS